jgi:hypothetical protein
MAQILGERKLLQGGSRGVLVARALDVLARLQVRHSIGREWRELRSIRL